MTRTEELLALAEAALVLDHNESAGWYPAENIVCQGAYYDKNARFIAAANPETIKQLVALCMLQHERLMWTRQAASQEHCNLITDEAIAAFNKFEQGGE